MNKNLRSYHTVTTSVICIFLLAVVFSTSNPLLLGTVLLTSVLLLLISGSWSKIKNGFVYYIPFFVITLCINTAFAYEGRTVLFKFLGKNITLEALIYSSVFSFRLLLVIYIFYLAGAMVDSDRAAAYFSSVMPKSTLMMIIGFKLIPTMRERFKNLKEIYSIRGVDYENKNIKSKLSGYMPVLSVLLEDSLDGAFDIGESVYVRGFLSARRTVYDRQPFKIKDVVSVIFSAAGAAFFIYLKAMRWDAFDVYTSIAPCSYVNWWILVMCLLLLVLTALLIIFSGENDYDFN